MRAGCSDADITSIKEGFKEALNKPILAVLSFRNFARTFSWFASTLHMMSQVGVHHRTVISHGCPAHLSAEQRLNEKLLTHLRSACASTSMKAYWDMVMMSANR